MIDFVYDYIVIGTGPSALGALLSLGHANVLVISNDCISLGKNKLHKKLRVDGLYLTDNRYGHFGHTSALGGLSRAWGGVLAVPNICEIQSTFNDVQTSSVISSYDFVLEFLSRHYSMFKVTENSITSDNNVSAFNNDKPNTYVLDRGEGSWGDGGLSVLPIINELINKYNYRLVVDEFINYLAEPNTLTVVTKSTRYKTNKLILASGALASSSIIDNNLDVNTLSNVSDHTPTVTICCKQKFESDICRNYGGPLVGVIRTQDTIHSIYNFNRFDFSFLKKLGLIGIAIYILPKFLKKKLYLVQSWSKSSTTKVFANKCYQKQLDVFIPGFKKITDYTTKPGLGFHYLLKEKIKYSLDPRLIVVGGISRCYNISVNPTLSLIVDAYIKLK